jgi:N-acetylmuramoyl-L-alanine amidase
MHIVISSGHGKYIRGASGVLDEVDEARKVVNHVGTLLGAGATEFHDDVSTSQSENLNRIIGYHNSLTRGLDVSVHFNAYNSTTSPMGCEVLYVSQYDLAKKVADAICAASGLKNRGAKKRTDLAFLNKTEEPAILIEVCFVDSSADADIYRAQFEAICGAISEAIAGVEAEPSPPPIEPTEPPPEPPPAHAAVAHIPTRIIRIQEILGVSADSVWAAQSQAHLDVYKVRHTVNASSFADPADIEAFKQCKAQGNTDEQCFKVGDNGIGKWGDSTIKGTGPCCALPPEQWNFFPNPRGRLVLVVFNGIELICPLKDTMPSEVNITNGCGIDLNYDAWMAFSRTPPCKEKVIWQWV